LKDENFIFKKVKNEQEASSRVESRVEKKRIKWGLVFF
jgi:hypothetical protein